MTPAAITTLRTLVRAGPMPAAIFHWLTLRPLLHSGFVQRVPGSYPMHVELTASGLDAIPKRKRRSGSEEVQP